MFLWLDTKGRSVYYHRDAMHQEVEGISATFDIQVAEFVSFAKKELRGISAKSFIFDLLIGQRNLNKILKLFIL